jgi:hypothetical protein
MASKYWLKLYYDMLDDSKIGKLRPALRWRFIETLLVAGECDDEGNIPAIDDYAWRVRSDPETIETDFVSLADAGLLSQNGGKWLVTNFAKRQAPIGSTERWRQWRDRQRKQEYQQEQTSFKRNQTDEQTKRLTDIDKIRIDIDGDKDNGQQPEQFDIVLSFEKRWYKSRGRAVPRQKEVREERSTVPIGLLLDRFNWNQDKAFNALENKRQSLYKSSGKTYIHPDLLVAEIFAATEKARPVIDHSDALIFDENNEVIHGNS